MERRKTVIIVAGGSGTRMGSAVPKQFLPLDGRPVLMRSMERFAEALGGDMQMILVLPEDSMPYWRELCLEHSFALRHTLVKGGLSRFHSVRNALEKVEEGALVAVHDAVRPLVSADLVRRLFDKAADRPAVIPAVPCTDTLKLVGRDASGELVPLPGENPDRSRIWCAQTPQIFHSEVLKRAYGQAYDLSFTDDASVVERAGFPIVYMEGERNNIKLTTPSDMILAEGILKIQQ